MKGQHSNETSKRFTKELLVPLGWLIPKGAQDGLSASLTIITMQAVQVTSLVALIVLRGV